VACFPARTINKLAVAADLTQNEMGWWSRGFVLLAAPENASELVCDVFASSKPRCRRFDYDLSNVSCRSIAVAGEMPQSGHISGKR